MTTPEEKYLRMKLRGLSREKIRMVARGREDNALLEYLKDSAACDAVDVRLNAFA